MNCKAFLQILGILLVFSGLSLSSCDSKSIFYVDGENGNDSNSGNTPKKAWKSIDRVNEHIFEPGSMLLFKGSQTFKGTLNFNFEDSGNPENSVTLTSFGEERATIFGGEHPALIVDSCNFLLVKNINFAGKGRKNGNTTSGIIVRKSKNIKLDSLEVYGFQKSGIDIGEAENIRITHVYAHNNGFAGISTRTYPEIKIKNVYVGFCLAENNPGDPTNNKNHSGNGILLCGVNGGTVEYCRATNNGWDQPWESNGPVGIWAWNCNRIVIQHCISHDNHTNPKGYDGGGFDFDGGVTNSILQYNYSYNNAGPGYGLFQFAGAGVWNNNIVRYNLSVNDARLSKRGGIHIWVGQSKNPHYSKALMGNALVYNNVIINDSGYAVYYKTAADVPGIRYYNNIFLSKKQPLEGDTGKSFFYRNLFWRFDGKSIDKTVDARGIYADPLLNLPENLVVELKDPEKIQTLAAYKLLEGSPCFKAGRSINDNGGKDFWGTPLPGENQNPNIGAYQTR